MRRAWIGLRCANLHLGNSSEILSSKVQAIHDYIGCTMAGGGAI